LKQSEQQGVQLGSMMIFGWGGNHFPDLRLLQIVKHLSADITMTVPQPRFLGGEDVNAEWIRMLEMVMETSSEISQDPEDWESCHESFVDSLILEETQGTAVVPELKVGHAVEDQASVVADWVTEMVEEGAAESPSANLTGNPIGCLVPGEGSSLYYLTRELEQRGILFHQEVGEMSPSGGFHTFHKLLVKCYVSHGDVEEVLRLLEWLLAREEPCVAGLDYQRLREKCLRRFNQRQLRSLSKLWPEDDPAEAKAVTKHKPKPDREDLALVQFARWLEPWPDQVSWEEARRRWVEVTVAFGFGTDYLEPVWSRLDEQLAGKTMPCRYFYEYLESLLGAPGLWRAEGSVNPYARIIVTTPEAATGRSWGALAFMDSQEGVWPVATQDNPFLKDSHRKELNQNIQVDAGQSRLLTRQDRDQSKRQLILDLIENCRGRVLFSGNLTDGRAPEVKTFPNEWAAQVLLASSDDPATALDRWSDSIKITRDEISVLNDEGAFRDVHRERENPECAPGAWDFSYEQNERSWQAPLNASRLETLLSAPASSALERLFKAVPRSSDDFSRKEALLLGIWTHAALARILEQGKLKQVPIQSIMEQCVPVQAPLSGLWMEVLAEKASWMVRSCLTELQELEGIWNVHQVEWSPETCEHQTSAGSLMLAGRVDLILSSSHGSLLIIDFKTGKTGEIPTPGKLKSDGSGLQYIAYLLMTEGSERTVRVINPFGAPEREMNTEMIENASQHLAALATMIHQNAYPRRRALRDEYGSSSETLPLTTLAIDEDILTAKWLKLIDQGEGL
jgi:hypothetical protein